MNMNIKLNNNVFNINDFPIISVNDKEDNMSLLTFESNVTLNLNGNITRPAHYIMLSNENAELTLRFIEDSMLEGEQICSISKDDVGEVILKNRKIYL